MKITEQVVRGASFSMVQLGQLHSAILVWEQI